MLLNEAIQVLGSANLRLDGATLKKTATGGKATGSGSMSDEAVS